MSPKKYGIGSIDVAHVTADDLNKKDARKLRIAVRSLLEQMGDYAVDNALIAKIKELL